eukprot:1161525-Pelagomonas_calceolata.AAC.16
MPRAGTLASAVTAAGSSQAASHRIHCTHTALTLQQSQCSSQSHCAAVSTAGNMQSRCTHWTHATNTALTLQQ